MAILINRKCASRLECLYIILKTIKQNFGSDEFIISEIRYDEDKPYNVFDYCSLKKVEFGRTFCPFLTNPLDPSKCYATQSLISDSTKAKNASATVRALEGLGLVVTTNDNKFKLSSTGEELCHYDFESRDWLDIVQSGVLSYGPINSFLLKASQSSSTFNSSKLYVSYPKTEEPINISIGSTADSNTRTRSMLVSWSLSTGLIEPFNKRNTESVLPQVFYRDLVNQSRLSTSKFIMTKFAKDYLDNKPYVANPLSYSALNKNIGSLRERNIGAIRTTTLEYNHIILNRRFALIYLLTHSFRKSIVISFGDLVQVFTKYKNHFFLPNSDIADILQTELDICPLAGLMVKVIPNEIKILNDINLNILSVDAPVNTLQLCKEMVNQL